MKKESLKIYATEILAVDPRDKKLKSWGGPYITAKNLNEANFLLQNCQLGYCRIVGELIGLFQLGNLNEIEINFSYN